MRGHAGPRPESRSEGVSQPLRRRRPARFGLLLSTAVAACSGSAPEAAPAPVPAPPTDVDAILQALTLEQRVGQLVFQWIPGGYTSTSSPEFLEIASWVEDLGIGGLNISIGLPHTYVAKLNELQGRARIPLLVTSDFENGGPGMRINHSYALPSLLPQGGGTSFSPTMSFGAVGEERFAREYGRITGAEARAVGVQLVFAPVLDVNSNPENPIINTRAFGEDPAAVARLGVAFMEGVQSAGVLTTAKHFPGHGDTRTDSHLELPEVPADRARLDTLELVPFRAAVASGVDAVMTAHVSVPGVLGAGALPATLSPVFMSELLRRDLGFEGVLFTDALRMGAITNAYGAGEAAVLSLEAGSDVILAPVDTKGAIEAVLDAVRSGRVSRERIDRSARRVLQMKMDAGLFDERMTDFEAVDERVGTASHRAFADSAASRAITVPRDHGALLPLDPDETRAVLSVTYGRTTAIAAGRTFNAALASGLSRLRTARVQEDTDSATYAALLDRAGDVDAVVISAYVPPRAGAGTVAVADGLRNLVTGLQGSGIPTIVISLGNPYLLSAFPDVGTYMIAWGDRETSQRAAARAVLGQRAVTGRLPISLPPLHRVGEGLDRAARPGAATSEDRRELLAEAATLPGAADSDEAGEPTTAADTVPLPMVTSPLELADPAEVGMSADGLAQVDSLLLAALADSAAPGAALAVGRNGRLVRLRGYGRLDWSEDAAPATPESLWDLASLTKVVGTTTAVMLLESRGQVSLDDLVIRYLPWWDRGDARKAEVTVRQLLLHRAGLPPFRRFFLDMSGAEAYRDAIADLPLEYAPGDSTVYSDIGLMTAAFIVEAVSGQSLDAFLEEELWSPLGMLDTGFRPDSSEAPRVAPTEMDAGFRGRHVRGEVHDENAWAIGGVAGHAGLFSTARDLAVFAAFLMEGGRAASCHPAPGVGVPCAGPRADAVDLLPADVVSRYTSRHDATASRALGWDTPTARSSAGRYFSASSWGHTGFTGTSLWMDPDTGVFVVLLTNRVNPTRENTRHVPLRRDLHDLVTRALDTPPPARTP